MSGPSIFTPGQQSSPPQGGSAPTPFIPSSPGGFNHNIDSDKMRRASSGGGGLALLLILVIGGALGVGGYFVWQANRIPWHTDLKEGVKAAIKSDKPMILIFSSPTCPPCNQMKEETWSHDDVRKKLQNDFVAVYLDVTKPENEEIRQRFSVRSWPTIIVTDPHGNVMKTPDGRMLYITGYMPQPIVALMLDGVKNMSLATNG